MWRASHPRRRIDVVAGLLLWLIVGIADDGAGAPLVDPRLTFHRLETAHFIIYFHDGEAAAAGRLGGIAEATWEEMGRRFGWTLPERTHVVLADQTDLSNGWATPLPYNTIMLTAAWPAGSEFIGLTDDWLRLVFTHEFTHIAHLDRSRGWARATRRLFGRVPLAFPNMFLPGWQIEGIATYYESAVTGRGRMFANDFRAVEREPARHGQALPIHRANGGLIRWPGSTTIYSSGLGFHQQLAQDHGAGTLVQLADRTAGRLPYFASRAFTQVYGAPLDELWRGYQQSLALATAGVPARHAATRLTFEAFEMSGPRFLPSSCAGCPDEIAYSVQTPHEFPALKAIGVDGRGPRTLTTRYLGTTFGATTGTVIFDQRELARNVGLYSDLYALDRQTGAVHRLTSEARLLDPDVSRDGRTIVAVRQSGGRRDLVTVAIDPTGAAAVPQVLLSEAETQFSTPRWSPDGRAIAAERHRLGETSHIVLVDPANAGVRVIASGATRAVTPTWRPDGRAVVAAVDSPDGPFNLVEFGLDGGTRRLTDTTGGALWPDVSADGRTLAFVGYTESGFDLFTQPYPTGPTDAMVPVALPTAPSMPAAQPPVAGADAAAASRYTPWATVLPRAWMPLVTMDSDQIRAGVTTGGADVLGYHAYATAVRWRVDGPSGASDSLAHPDWSVAYVYNRWQPQFFASAARSTSYLQGASAETGGISTWRERTIEAGVVLPLRRVLQAQQLVFSGQRSSNLVTGGTTADAFTRLSLRSGWAYRSARIYGYSISPEDGVAAGVGAEIAGAGPRSIADATTVTGDVRAYLPGPARHHVLALRAAGGISAGPRSLGRTFRLGGAMPNADALDFGRGAFSLLRGFPLDRFAGRRIVVANADYRFPLAWIERGRGTWPVFVRTLHGSVFADAGHAWTSGFQLSDLKVAAGVELSTDVVLGYGLPITLTAGVARGHDGAGRVPATTTGYVRIGRAF